MDNLITPESRCLLIAAAPREFDAVLDAWNPAPDAAPGTPIQLDNRFDLIRSGVGKSAAAATTARALTLKPYTSVLSIGVAGSLPGQKPLDIGQSVTATRSYFSDEGVGTPEGFTPMSDLGFAPFTNGQMWTDHHKDLTTLLAGITDASGTIATVSWCSGHDGCAQGVVNRTGAIAEAMEGAAVAQASQIMDPSILTGELRVISNTTGNRATQRWDLERALGELTRVLGRLR